MNAREILLTDTFHRYGFDLNDLQVSQFLDFYSILLERNKTTNLTSITEYSEVVEKHFIDSIYSALFFDFFQCDSVIDVGSGAGFPGIPLKIMFPHLKLTLLDSVGKKIHFLEEAVHVLALNEVDIEQSRAEDAAREERFRCAYNVCVSRAVAKLPVLCEYCTPFIRPSGVFIAYKGSDVSREIIDIEETTGKLGCKVSSVQEFTLQNNKRSLIFITRTDPLDDRYPRTSSKIIKRPL